MLSDKSVWRQKYSISGCALTNLRVRRTATPAPVMVRRTRPTVVRTWASHFDGLQILAQIQLSYDVPLCWHIPPHWTWRRQRCCRLIQTSANYKLVNVSCLTIESIEMSTWTIAQTMPEFLPIVLGSLHNAKKFPWPIDKHKKLAALSRLVFVGEIKVWEIIKFLFLFCRWVVYHSGKWLGGRRIKAYFFGDKPAHSRELVHLSQ